MKHTNSANGNTFTDEMKVNLHVLGALMLNRVGGEVDRADIVAIDEAGGGEWVTKFLEKLP
jgi:nucleoside-triphosphatase THEP1